MKVIVRANPLGISGLLLAVLAFFQSISAQAALTVNATSVYTGAESAFDGAANVGITILTFLVALSAVLMGWRVARGRGK